MSTGPELRKDPFYITTPIYYVNGQPHLGHAYTSVVTDIIARFKRKDGHPVHFLTGTDEHGQKVEQSATSNNKTPSEFADEVSAKFRDMTEILGCSNDDFIRTTEDRHKVSATKLWKLLEANNQIYLGAYEGWYSVRDESYYQESELIDGKAPTGADVEWVKEESYFFRLSDWTDKLLKFYDENPDFIAPKSRRNEVIAFLKQEGGLKDLSISRTTFSWGIPVPGNEKHVMYVWLDALANYISALDFAKDDDSSDMYKKFWPASLHIVGKDILRFHCIFWPAFLMAAQLSPPKRVFAHGWWTKDGEKMSKSVGNVLDPLELLNKYGKDYLRYFLVAEVPFGNDGDFSDSGFALRVNSDLANDVGNLAQRALTMIDKHCDGKIPQPGQSEVPAKIVEEEEVDLSCLTPEDHELLAASAKALDEVRILYDKQALKPMCEAIINISKLGNKYIDVQAPWTLKKNNDIARMHTVLYTLVETLRRIGILLDPIMPDSSSIMLKQLGACDPSMQSFDSFKTPIRPGSKIGTPIPVFPKIERDEADVAPVVKKGEKKEKKKILKKVSPMIAIIAQEYADSSLDDLATLIVKEGETVRNLKTQKAGKDQLMPHIEKLVGFKELFKVKNDGKSYEA